MEEITEIQKHKMLHALGLDYKETPFRNYACYYSPEENWEDLVKKELAILRVIKPTGADLTTYYYYFVTEKGAKLLEVELPND